MDLIGSHLLVPKVEKPQMNLQLLFFPFKSFVWLCKSSSFGVKWYSFLVLLPLLDPQCVVTNLVLQIRVSCKVKFLGPAAFSVETRTWTCYDGWHWNQGWMTEVSLVVDDRSSCGGVCYGVGGISFGVLRFGITEVVGRVLWFMIEFGSVIDFLA